jgi:hypothetical protein
MTLEELEIRVSNVAAARPSRPCTRRRKQLGAGMPILEKRRCPAVRTCRVGITGRFFSIVGTRHRSRLLRCR